jgi:hypothetical protein
MHLIFYILGSCVLIYPMRRDLSHPVILPRHLPRQLFNRIEVVFNRYYKDSIKSGTRKRRGKRTRPVRRVIEK